jgi:DNA-binding CsgD family transcriptional regulator
MAMEIAVTGLTEQERIIARLISEGLSPVDISHRTGYTIDAVYWHSRKPSVTAAVRIFIERQLVSDAGAARAVLRQLLDDPTVNGRVRADCARILLDRGGFVPPKAKEREGDDIALSEMNPDQLRSYVARAQRELADRAKPVIDVRPADSAPQRAPGDSDLSDLLG